MPKGFLNTRMRFHANLNCDKLRISYAGCNSISPLHTARDEKIFLEGSHRLSVSGKTICCDLEGRKVTGPFCEAAPRLYCAVPVWWWWEALDLSRIARAPSGPPVHRYELRRGRLWIAGVVSAFYQNWPGFCAVFPKRSVKSVCCSNT